MEMVELTGGHLGDAGVAAVLVEAAEERGDVVDM